MLKFFGKLKRKKSKLDVLLDEAYTVLGSICPVTEADDYDKQLDYVERLHALKSEEKKKGVSIDTLVTVGGSLASVLAILGYEKVNVLTSKATGFIRRF